MNPHEHEWVDRAVLHVPGAATAGYDNVSQQCQVCGSERRVTRVHQHEWTTSPDRLQRACLRCPEKQSRALAEFSGTPFIDRLKTVPWGTTVANRGGVVSYDPAHEMVRFKDNFAMSLEQLIAANPEYRPHKLRGELRRALTSGPTAADRLEVAAERLKGPMPDVAKVAEAFRAGMITAEEAAKSFQEAMSQFATVNEVSRNMPQRKWTSEDALTLILEEVRHAPDPLKVGGEWIAKVTNGISQIIRETDDGNG